MNYGALSFDIAGFIQSFSQMLQNICTKRREEGLEHVNTYNNCSKRSSDVPKEEIFC